MREADAIPGPGRYRWTLLKGVFVALLSSVSGWAWSQSDTTELPLPHGGDVPNPVETPGGVSLDFPDVIEYGVDYDETTGQYICLLYTSPSPRDRTRSRMPSSA